MDMKDYNIVIVLGNGFDLDLNLKTSYSDFIESNLFKDNLKDKLLSKVDYKFSRRINIFHYLSDQYNLKKWIDVENELLNLAQRRNETRLDVAKATSLEVDTFLLLHETLCKYLFNLSYEDINKDSTALALLKIVCKYSQPRILTYNYTDLYKLEEYVGSIKCSVEHIHGSVSDNSIILGFQDDVEIDDSYCFMIKSFSPHFKSHNVRRQLLDADEIIFFGHSLGETDYHYFKDLFMKQSNETIANEKLRIRIFTYNEQSRIEILTQLRNMNERKTNLLYGLCDFAIYRTDGSDKNRINNYLEKLKSRAEKGFL